MGKIYMTACMKGGCAKTVTTYNLAYSLKELGKKVLCVDFDNQANLSTCFGVENPAAVPVTIGHLMMAQIDDDELSGFKEYIQSRNGVDFISSSMMLSAVDAKLRLEMGAEKMLSEILEPLRDRYDAIIIDTAPTLGEKDPIHKSTWPFLMHLFHAKVFRDILFYLMPIVLIQRINLKIARPLCATMAKMHRACQDNYVTQNGHVRRLTPRECARLQGFSDTFKIPVSDTQAYKQFGNAVTVNVSRVVAESVRESLQNLGEWND